MRDFRKKAMTNTQKKKSLMDTYKEMWEDGEKCTFNRRKYGKKHHEKDAKSRVAKGMKKR